MDVYDICPQFHSEHFILRQVRVEDWEDLLKVYSDRKAVPLFNSDNCIGDFYITREEDIRNMISFWLMEYEQRYYVRWSVLDRASGCAVGTIELFRREAQDFYTDTGLLRLDLRSDYETEDAITAIVSPLLSEAYSLFGCGSITTKIPPCAQARRSALSSLGFQPCPELLYGHDGTAYGDYFILNR